MNRMSEPNRASGPDRCLVLILEVGALGALLATLASALFIAILTGLPIGPRPDLSNGPSVLDIGRTAFFLCAITVVSCGSFGFVAGVAGSAWLRFRKRRILSTKRLLGEAAVAGLLLGGIFPLFDGAVNSPSFQRIGVLLNPIQMFFCVVFSIVCALICALVFRDRFIERRSSFVPPRPTPSDTQP